VKKPDVRKLDVRKLDVRRRLRDLGHRVAPREHRRLRRSGYGFAFAESVSQLNPRLWDAATAGWLLHAVVADAIDLGCRRLSLGHTALEPKARLGAQPEPMEMWVKHRTGGVNLALGLLLGSIEPTAAPARNPFKKTRD